MTNYYNIHEGNLHPGDIAKAQDINQIQQNIADALRNLLEDLHHRQGCILGSEENAFILTPETKRNGRFIDQMNLAEGDDAEYISIREIDYRQTIKLSHSSLYSIIVKLQNKSEQSVNVTFELHDTNSNLIEGKKTILELPANSGPTEYEIIFDLDYYPTAHGIDHEDLENNVQGLTIPKDNENNIEGIDHGEDNKLENSSLGASEIYLVVRALNKNKFDVNQNEDGYIWNDEDPTFGILMNKNSSYGQLLEEDTGSGFVPAQISGDLYFKTIYTNNQSYRCEFGEALVGGEKVCLADSHVSVDGASSYGDVLSYVYMDVEGHLHAKNTDPYIGETPEPEIPDEPHLHIANIITYADSSKDPLIIQDDTNQDTRLRSHHERIRRLEKQMNYTQDIAIPPRLKYTKTGTSWIDSNPEKLISGNKFNTEVANTLDNLSSDGYVVTTDSDGNFVVKVTKAESFNIPITLKSSNSGVVKTVDKTKILKSAQTSTYINSLATSDTSRAQIFSNIKNMKVDITNGIMTLDGSSNSNIVVATTKKEAKETEFNPWDDFARNRPTKSNVKPTEREFTVTSGKNGKNDWASTFPAMTLYVSNNYKLSKLEIPIHKFKNCTGVKFIIYKRQDPNRKDNTVWLQKRIYTSSTYSLKKAKIKNKYQYMDEGFLIDFGKKGLTLEKGQYVIIALPIVASGKGSVFVETYKPDNSRDFLIEYYGAANASHFLLKHKYQEIWYNTAKATGEVVEYSNSGSVTSGTVTWTDKEPIKSIKPVGNITQPKGTEYKLEVDIGSGWQEVELNKVNTLSGGKNSFRWRITFKGNKKETPKLKYNKNKKYALNFEITRADPSASSSSAASDLDKNLCLTSIPFDGNNILREYIGDMNFALTDNKFSNYEFARIWGNDTTKEELRIDLSGSDYYPEIKDTNNNTLGYYTVYSMHYVDLKLKDFEDGSVDYSNYTAQMEIDEHNKRLKLDTEHSYNDDEIKLLNINEFKITDENFALSDSESSDYVGVDLTNVPSSDSNITLMKAQLDNTLNLAQYDAIRVGLSINGNVDGTLSGLALYISSTYEPVTPSNIANEPNEEAILIDTLPDLNSSQQEVIDMYANHIVKRFEPINGTGAYVYYQSVWDSDQQKWIWELLHNIKSYDLYEIVDKETKVNKLTITEDNNDKEIYYEITINPNKVNLQYAKEIGLVLLNDEEKVEINEVTGIKLHNFITIQQDYYPIFQASKGDKFTMALSQVDTISKSNASGSISNVKKTKPETSQIIMNYNTGSTNKTAISSSGATTIATFDTVSKNTENYNHIAIQMSSDCLLVKNMLELHLIQIDDKTGVEKVIDKINLPTNNYMYYATQSNSNINLVQVFKKLETNERFDKIALVATSNFIDYAKKLKTVNGSEQTGCDGNKTISLFIGNISLYQARTIPMFHPRMRFKFYFDQTQKNNRDYIDIRKIGVIANYQ